MSTTSTNADLVISLGTERREALGDALHHAMHPSHPWSGCDDPERVYDRWMPRFLTVLREAGYDIHRRDEMRFLDDALNSGDGTYKP